MTNKALLVSVGLLVVLVSVVGCERRTAPVRSDRTRVTGTVSLDGKPLPGGIMRIVLANDEMFGVMCGIKSDGTFIATDAPLGDALISVDTRALKFNSPKNYVPIPEKYADVKTSGLTAKIVAGQPEGMTLTLELKSK